MSVARKELRAYFLSPIALIFLGTFLFVTLFTFFWVEQFFARNIADVRPLFSWLPVLLIFLCSALTMRLWSEEQKVGTLEILLTLPVKTGHLVLGKFLASLGLVAVALLLTLGVPVTVSMLGDLDWGPVLGGYLAALLLAGAYLSIGLWISSITENQIISLILSVVVCGLLYLLGSDPLVESVGNRGAEILSALGSGSRFESIRRGVLDLRDLAYYLSIIGAFLAFNILSLQMKGFSDGNQGATKRRNAVLMPVLVAVNLVVFNILISGIGLVRADLTERGEYSISRVTKDILRSLDEPLLVRGYFSSKTHPLLAPMVPQIRDIIEEYGVIGGNNVVTEYVDPREDEELEKEARQLYNIRSFPFRVADRLDVEVVNSYFSILVKYGDEYEVLNFDQLIEVSGTSYNNIEVRLRNLEYDLTRAIKKVAFGFQTLDAVFADLDEPAEFTAFITPETLPPNYAELPDVVQQVSRKLEEQADGKFIFRSVDPSASDAAETPESLRQKFGFRPYQSLLGGEPFYLHLLLKVGDRYERVAIGDDLSQAALEQTITASLERAAPGFLKTIGLVKPEVEPPNPNLPPQLRQQQNQDFTQALTETLSENYGVEDVALESGRVPSDVDVLVVYAPKDFGDNERFAIDQFLMRGGTVIIYDAPFRINPGFGGALQVEKVNSGLAELYQAYGLNLTSSMVMDPQNEGIQIPIQRNVGGFTVQEIRTVSYPFFVDVRGEGLADSPVIGGIPSLTVPFAAPVVIAEEPEADDAEEKASRYTALLTSSPEAWTTEDTNVQPDFQAYGENGFPEGDDRKTHTLAVLGVGSFESAFADEKSPNGDPVTEQSPDTTRFVLVGSTAVVSDLSLQLSRQAGTSNLQLAQNLVDWGVEDTDLLSIRSRSTFARTLIPMEASTRRQWELINYGIVVILLALLIVFTIGRRRQLQPLDLSGGSTAPTTLEKAEVSS